MKDIYEIESSKKICQIYPSTGDLACDVFISLGAPLEVKPEIALFRGSASHSIPVVLTCASIGGGGVLPRREVPETEAVTRKIRMQLLLEMFDFYEGRFTHGGEYISDA